MLRVLDDEEVMFRMNIGFLFVSDSMCLRVFLGIMNVIT